MPSIQFDTTIRNFSGDMLTIYFVVPEELVKTLTKDGANRFICTINGMYEHPCALHRSDDIGHYIYLSKRVRKELEVEPGDTLHCEIREDTSEYGMPMPEELSELFEIDPEGKRAFDTLTPGRQRGLIHYIGSAKRVDTRIQRALTIVDNLKLGIRDPQQLIRNRR